MNTITIIGNGYEEGLRAGKEVAGKWKPAVTTRLEKWREAVIEAPTTLAPGRDLGEVMADLERWTQEDLWVHAADLHRRKMDALPELKRFPELKGMDQYLDEQTRGFAEGAGIDVREVYLQDYWREIIFYVTGGGRRPNPGSCSEFFFPDTPKGPLRGKGWDDIMAWYTDNPFSLPPAESREPPINIIPPRDEGRGYRRHGTINEVGLCLDTGGGATYEYEEERDEALFPAPVHDLVMRSCATALEAVEMLTRYNIYWGPCNCVVSDAEGKGALIEKSKYHYAVRMSDRNVLITTYGGCEDEDMRRWCDTSTPLFGYYQRRLQVMKEIVIQAGERLDLEVFWKSLLHHDSQAPGCTHRENKPPGVELFTFGGFALLSGEGRSFSRTIARENGRIRYACANPVVESRYRFA